MQLVLRDTHEIDWRTREPRATEEMIAAVEHALGIRYPADFRALAPVIHGGAPSPSSFSYQHREIGTVGTSLEVVLSFDPSSDYNVLRTMHALEDGLLPPGVVPFGEDGGGDLIAFDFRTDPDHPSVVYVATADAAETGERHIYPLVDSFTRFLEMLAGT
jgi:cell wall assembly regulator SMI1